MHRYDAYLGMVRLADALAEVGDRSSWWSKLRAVLNNK